MEKIKCTIERITFQNPENGYSVLQTTIKGYREEQTVVGIFHEVTVGAVLTVEGNWRVDKRYGRQFAAEKWTEELPADIIGIEKYLGSGLVKGIGPKMAKLIVKHFGLETFEVIENDADRLLEVPGIGKGRVGKIRDSWEKQKDVKDIMVFLQGHGVSSTYAAIPTVWLMTSGASASKLLIPSQKNWATRRTTLAAVVAESSIRWASYRRTATAMLSANSW